MRAMARPLAGFSFVAVVVVIVLITVQMFRGALSDTAPLTVISQRAGLVMNPSAKVKLLGVQVGTVASIQALGDGRAALHLAIEPAMLRQIPDNVIVNIA